jgi:hypothetical protein
MRVSARRPPQTKFLSPAQLQTTVRLRVSFGSEPRVTWSRLRETDVRHGRTRRRKREGSTVRERVSAEAWMGHSSRYQLTIQR